MGRLRKDGMPDRRYKNNKGGCAGILIIPIALLASLIYFIF